MRNKGFTMMELVVVMAIIAILAAMLVPAVNRARKKAAINKAEAEMASLASTGGMIYLDTGEYLCLDDATDVDTTIMAAYDTMAATGTTRVVKTNNVPNWDGPYTTWQPSQMFSPTNGSVPTDGGGTGWNFTPGNPTDNTTDFRYTAPLDPWNHPYCLAWNNDEKVMVIYSAGPDGKVQTTAGAVIASGDDLLYKFK